jgi:FlaA1/EpsC-like NDP-sugar epimerase
VTTCDNRIKKKVQDKNYVKKNKIEKNKQTTMNNCKNIDMLDKIPQSFIQQYYEGKVVFLTGGTGFLGKLLIHKLIR